MSYPTVKALHLIGMVAWFAGLFYMPRLLIYDVEAQERPETERAILHQQLRLMARRLWFGITWPAMIFTVVFGVYLVVLYDQWSRPWIHVKLTLVALLVVYHLVMGRIRRQLVEGRCGWSSTQLRLWNELATLHLIITVLVASLKEAAFHWTVPVGVVATLVSLTLGVMVYKKVRLRGQPPAASPTSSPTPSSVAPPSN
ncbi:MAG: CopD family protein [Myxococcota bacterium]